MTYRDGWIARYLVAFVIVVGTAAAIVAHANTPAPSPYTSATDATLNALGGVARNVGWTRKINPGAGAEVDALANMPTALSTYFVANPGVLGQVRIITIKRIFDDGVDANLALCAQLGPSDTSASSSGGGSDSTPALTCPARNSTGAGANAGGCMLIATGDSCTFTIRPVVNSTGSSPTYPARPLPSLWVAGSGTTGLGFVHVSVHW